MQARGWAPNHPPALSEAEWTHPQFGKVHMALDLAPLVQGPMQVNAGGQTARDMNYKEAAGQVALLESKKPLNPAAFRRTTPVRTMSRRHMQILGHRAAVGQHLAGG